jgi:L-2,4-diaminobutyric acid acetyltransferase
VPEPGEADPLKLRPPAQGDGAALWRLAVASEGLEANTCYAYLLLATHFADTCVLAEEHGRPVGYIAAYRPPSRPDTVFVWQIGVAPEARRRGLGKRMLRALLARPACRDVRWLESTVTPSNAASQRLFLALARDLGAACRRTAGFAAADFDGAKHEDEELFRIGPLEPEELDGNL